MFLAYFSKLLDYILSYIYYVELINESAYVKLFTARRNVGGIKFEDVQSFGPIGTHKATIVWLHDIGETSANFPHYIYRSIMSAVRFDLRDSWVFEMYGSSGMETNACKIRVGGMGMGAAQALYLATTDVVPYEFVHKCAHSLLMTGFQIMLKKYQGSKHELLLFTLLSLPFV
ncbi:T2E6.12 [Arabidopsis thaliana]|uniref:T2E6.12 n=1 Tax=Arabidopsis thaliana TaxID=3702 RepID=Q9FZF7_ARATH|nr:T2E6.12 [Arabidopsis thaliana]